jgi:hypothetical protein
LAREGHLRTPIARKNETPPVSYLVLGALF